MKNILGRDVAEKQFNEICEELCIDTTSFDDDEGDSNDSKKKMVFAIMHGRLSYEKKIFTLNLLEPLNKGKEKSSITSLKITEPVGDQLRATAIIKKKRDEVGKAMAVLGEVTKLGLPMINKLGSRDLMVAVGVIGLFL